MSEYIKREDAIDAVNINKGQRFGEDRDMYIKRLLRELPTADVAEVRHGHWIRGRKICDIPNDSDYEWKCSECYHTDVHNAKVQVDYCWHCGAKMDGEEQDHD